eukprot:7550960-Ditylum_brightwellii.AAC.1
MIHDTLDAWHNLTANLASRPTHFHKLVPTHPSWVGAHGACKAGMGGDNPSGNIAIIDLELVAHVMQLALWVPMTVPLEHMFNATDSKVTGIYARKDTVSKLGMVALFLVWWAHILRTHQVAFISFYLPATKTSLSTLPPVTLTCPLLRSSTCSMPAFPSQIAGNT